MSCSVCPAGAECLSVNRLPQSCDPGYYSLEGGKVWIWLFCLFLAIV